MDELVSLGLSPTVLKELLESTDSPATLSPKGKGKELDPGAGSLLLLHNPPLKPPHYPKVVYEFNGDLDRIEPRLRLWINLPSSDISPRNDDDSGDCSERDPDSDPYDEVQDSSYSGTHHMSLLWALQRRSVQDVSKEQLRVPHLGPSTLQIAPIHNTTPEYVSLFRFSSFNLTSPPVIPTLAFPPTLGLLMRS